jgi:hypothetical protein
MITFARSGRQADTIPPSQSLRWHVTSSRTQYLGLVASEAIREFTTLRAEERDRQVRARMCQVLAKVGRPAVPVLLEWLHDSCWFLVRNLVHVLGKIGEESVFARSSPAGPSPRPRPDRGRCARWPGLTRRGLWRQSWCWPRTRTPRSGWRPSACSALFGVTRPFRSCYLPTHPADAPRQADPLPGAERVPWRARVADLPLHGRPPGGQRSHPAAREPPVRESVRDVPAGARHRVGRFLGGPPGSGARRLAASAHRRCRALD